MLIPELVLRKPELEALCRQFGVLRLDVFGSAASGDFSAQSDIDLLVEFAPEAKESGYADRYFGLLEALEQLFSRPVELVVASAIRNPYFRQSVEQTRELLYAS